MLGRFASLGKSCVGNTRKPLSYSIMIHKGLIAIGIIMLLVSFNFFKY